MTVYTLADLETEPIERVEEGEDTVRYKALRLLAPGVWTDSGSRETIWYSPRGMEGLDVTEDNVVNIMHDAGNDVSKAGRIDPGSVEASEDGLYADIVLDTSNAAGQYADENLKKTLETQGAKGFGGPSVEIDAEGQQVEFNEEKGMRELLGGIISGVGLVKNPASKPVSFARQTANRGVALSSAQSTMYLQEEIEGMTAFDLEQLREEYGLSDDVDEDTIHELAEAGLISLEDDEDEDEEEEEEEEDRESEEDEEDQPPEEEEDEEGGEDDEEEDEEEETEMGEDEIVETVQALQERVSNLEDMAESMMAAEDVEEALSDELEEAKSDLADAETVQELEDAKEDLDKRLSELEDEPKPPKTLSDGEGDELEGTITPAGEYDDLRRTYSR